MAKELAIPSATSLYPGSIFLVSIIHLFVNFLMTLSAIYENAYGVVYWVQGEQCLSWLAFYLRALICRPWSPPFSRSELSNQAKQCLPSWMFTLCLLKAIMSSHARHFSHVLSLGPLIVPFPPFPTLPLDSYFTLTGTPSNLSLHFCCQSEQLWTQKVARSSLEPRGRDIYSSSRMGPPSRGIGGNSVMLVLSFCSFI